jgi:cytochrome c553
MSRRLGVISLRETLGLEIPNTITKATLRADMLLAKKEANRLAGVWGQRFLEATNDPIAIKTGNLAAPVVDKMAWRYTITTEIQANQVWNEERHKAARYVADRVPGKTLVKVWSAMGERRTCGICHGMDGRSILAEDQWPRGNPGTVHPRCRCDEVYEMVESWLVDRYAA